MNNLNKIFVSDFETSFIKKENRVRVWLWVLKDIWDVVIYRGYDIESYFETIFKLSQENKINSIYFHNIKFDGNFLLRGYLCKKKFNFVPNNEKKLENYNFRVLWVKNHILNITLKYDDKLIRFLCSKYIFTVSIRQLSKMWKVRDKYYIMSLNISNQLKNDILYNRKIKGKINYQKERKEGYIPTQEEIDYTDFDILPLENIIKEHINNNMFVYNKFTKSSWTVLHWKKTIWNKKKWLDYNWFNVFNESDKDYLIKLHHYYKGGLSTPIYKNLNSKLHCNKKIYSYDIVSCYPNIMRNMNTFPIGKGIQDCNYNKCNHSFFLIKFKVLKNVYTISKVNHIYNRFKKIRYSNVLYKNSIYYYTNFTYKILINDIKKNDLKHIKVVESICFETEKIDIFDKHIDYYMEQKNKYKKEGNKCMRLSSKFMMNSLYGKFTTSPFVKKRTFLPIEEYKSKHKLLQQRRFGDYFVKVEDDFSISKGIYYVPLGIYITSYQRSIIMKSLIDNKDTCLYTDTDSLFLTTNQPKGLNLGNKLGQWEYKKEFLEGYFIKPKRYVLKTLNNEWNFTISSIKGGKRLYRNIDITKLNSTIKLKKIRNKIEHCEGGVNIKKINITLKK